MSPEQFQSLHLPWLMLVVSIAAIFGLGLWMMGIIFAIITALGDDTLGAKRWLWAGALLLAGPISVWFFCRACPSAAYVHALMKKGALLLLPAVIIVSALFLIG